MLDLLQEEGICDVRVKCLGLPDRYIEQGSQQIIRKKYGLDAAGIAAEAERIVAASEAGLPVPDIRK